MISVVVPAYNEEKIIRNCLEALVGQQTTKKFEVLLVNNNSTDKTVEVAKEFENKVNLRIILEEKKGRGAARWRGFEEAKGEIILSTDADTIVPSDWIEKLTDYLKKSDAIAVTGTCKIVDCSRLTNLVFNFLQPQFMKTYRLLFGHYWLSGFNFAVYKDAYDKSGGFEKSLNIQEDVDLSFRVANIGKIKYLNNIPVVFSGRRFQKGLFSGLLPYVKTFADYFFFKKKNMILGDVR